MNYESVYKTIQKVLSCDRSAIEFIEPAGGLTNANYTVTVAGEKYIVRIPGAGTEELVNRQTEKANLLFATKLGINPPFVYFDETTGIKITRKIEDPTTLTAELASDPLVIKQVAALLRQLHGIDQVMINRFDLNHLINHYETLVSGINPVLYDSGTYLQNDIAELLALYNSLAVPEVPCHIDTGYFNFILNDIGQLYLIDWEYSGMFDPLWDIAGYMHTSEFTPEEAQLLLETYFNREPTFDETQRVQLHKIFQDYLWGLWSAYKEALGAHPGVSAVGRFERAKHNIALFSANEQKEVV